MLNFMSIVRLSRSNTSWVYCHSGNFQGSHSGLIKAKSFHSFVASKSTSRSLTLSKTKRTWFPLAMATIAGLGSSRLHLGLTNRYHSMSLNLSLPKRPKFSRINWNTRHMPWKIGGASLGLCLSFSNSGTVLAEASSEKKSGTGQTESCINTSHGKKVYTDYSIIGIPGDGRCLFRSVAHGACVRSGKPVPDEELQRELADELRAMVADEFVKRRADSEWFVEGDFDTYVSHIRKPHVWGGEPELFMASHVLQMPITVYMRDDDADGLIAIAKYGQEYGKEDPIKVLYHGFGHYDALLVPGRKVSKSRL